MTPGKIYKHKAMKDVAFQIISTTKFCDQLKVCGVWVNIAHKPYTHISPEDIKIHFADLKKWEEV